MDYHDPRHWTATPDQKVTRTRIRDLTPGELEAQETESQTSSDVEQPPSQQYNAPPAPAPSPPRNKLLAAYDYLRLDVFTVYRNLWCLIVAANLAAIAVVISRNAHKQPLSKALETCINAAAANLLAGTLVRQDYVKNIMFGVCWSIPHSAPLWLRRRVALVYENGGVHSGAGVGATLWFFAFTGFLWTEFASDGYGDAIVLAYDCVLVVLLLAILVGAMPHVRRKHHNLFEIIHRLAGWIAILLFLCALVLYARDEALAHPVEGRPSIGSILVRLPAFWMLVIVAAHAVYPWLSLRRVPVQGVQKLSDHAIRVYFSPKEHITPLRGCAISLDPLYEWHSFAVISDVEGTHGGCSSVIMSKAGDWTSRQIESPPPYFYMRGVHAAGVLAMAKVFKSVVVMATGSGVGPCLAVFGHLPQTKVRFIWSTPSPQAIFGKGICDRVYKQDPNAIIWDTRQPGKGRPDLTEMAHRMFVEEGAEAVFFISNRNLTKKVIRSLRLRGVPAFAPVFDS